MTNQFNFVPNDLKTITKEQALENIKATAKKAKDLNNDYHKDAMTALVHAEMHGNAELLTFMYVTLRESKGRSASFKDWVQRYSPFEWGPTGKDKKGRGFKKDKSEEAKAFDIDAAMLDPFFTPEEKEIKDTLSLEDLQKSIERLVKRANKAVKNSKVEGNVIDFQGYLDSLEALEALPDETQVSA